MKYILRRPSLSDTHISYREFVKLQELVEMCANIQFDQNFYVKKSSNGIQVGITPSATTDMDWSQMAFGFEITAPRTITVKTGKIGSIEIAEQDITLGETEDTHYVWIRQTLSDDTMTLQSGTTWPTDDETYNYYVLHAFDVDADGNATLNLVRKVMDREEKEEGEDELPSNAGKSKYMVLQLSADNATEDNDPDLWTIDYVRAHA